MRKLYLTVCLILLVISHSEAQVWGEYDSRTESRDNAGLQGDAGAKSGFYHTVNPVNYPAGAQSWWHLLDIRHSNPANNFAMQFSGSFYDQNLYFRKTINSASQTWSKVVLETDSKVGIGIQNPTGRLEVAAPLTGLPGPSGTFHLNGGQAWGHVLTLATDNSGGADDARLLFSYRNHAKQWAMGGLNNTDRFSIWEDSGDGSGGVYGFGTERLTVQAGGNIGIGTSDTRGFKLAVNGTIRSKEVKVEAGPWPDYVFKSSYHLPSLSQVKAYVERNRHLPEIPSGQQVAKDGINLGEMNKLLVKKVEELTLYLIEMDKKDQQKDLLLKSLQKQINQLKRRK